MGDEDNFLATVLQPGIQETIKAAAAKFSSEEMVNKRENLRIAFEQDLTKFVSDVLVSKGVPGLGRYRSGDHQRRVVRRPDLPARG